MLPNCTSPTTCWSPTLAARTNGHDFIALAPEWLCEIVSPSTARHDRGAKRDIYGRHGLRHIRHVDPDARLLEAFELGADGRWVLLKTCKDNESIDAAPFGEVPFELGLLWVHSGQRRPDVQPRIPASTCRAKSGLLMMLWQRAKRRLA